jgi:hypothetical protein
MILRLEKPFAINSTPLGKEIIPVVLFYGPIP